ncbi:uncharacterized protein K441DRAFT_141883 [Cenococcum geophilum 1.58]|uniref:uncharacterized protein n=1 Tax=Cenococcum geophilum 1.58 TaxID=794803 RepID=UPI003590027C|nr:hypothetical protein K441DRAFT_141883 [Cenococcum geophilum 1.58]
MGSKDGCTLPNALHGDVRRGLAAQQPTPHPILSLRVWNIFFLVQLFCLSASRPAPHSCTASGPAVLPLRAKRATTRCNWPAASDYAQSRAESSALEASCREGRTSSPELPMRWTDSTVGGVGLPEASGGMRCTGRFRSRGVNGGAPSPSAGFCGLHLAKITPLPKSRASSGCPKGKVPESHTQLCDSIARFSLPAQRGGPKRWLSWRERTPAGVASSGAVLPSMSLPLSPSLFSPCSESQSASDPTAAPPPMACLAGYLGRDTCRIRTAAWEARGPAADWSFVRLTGFRSSIRVMELWGVQSCIGACFARCFPRSLACARAGTARNSKPQPVNQNPKSPVKPIAKRTTTEPAREGRGAEGKKNIANCSGCSAQHSPRTKTSQ